MLIDDVFRLLFGLLGPGEHIAPYSASFVFFAVTMGLGWLLRSVNELFTPKPIRAHIATFLATLELCAYFLENNFIYDNYGAVPLFIAVTAQLLVAQRTFYGASSNPTEEFTKVMEKEMSFSTGFVRVVVQIFAGFASFGFCKLIWSLDMVSEHKARFVETSCASDLTVVFWVGFLLEMVATVIQVWMERQVLITEPIADEILKVGSGALLYVIGIDYTGIYCNPAMAIGHMLGCKGTSEWEHFVVYWVGPMVGCYAAIALDNVFHVDVTTLRRRSVRRTPRTNQS